MASSTDNWSIDKLAKSISLSQGEGEVHGKGICVRGHPLDTFVPGTIWVTISARTAWATRTRLATAAFAFHGLLLFR